MKAPQIPEGATVAFFPPPPLWPEQYTDCFCLNLLASREECEDLALAIDTDTASSHFEYNSERRHLFTNDQMVVEMATEKLYGREIASTHIHIPNRHDDQF